MKTNLRLLALLLMILGFAQNTAHAQCPGVWVPDSAFRVCLMQNYPQIFNSQDSLLPCEAANITGYLGCANSPTVNMPIRSLEGIEYFTNLSYFYSNQNRLGHVANLPHALKHLALQNDSVTTIAYLPDSLRSLNVNANYLTSLPPLPPKLNYLECINCRLRTLSNLGDSLTEILCWSNQLTALPALPKSLRRLNCMYNMLTSLPALPDSLRQLFCYNNSIAQLPTLPPLIEVVVVNNNRLTSLPFLPAKITGLNFSNNQISMVPTLPDSLESISCSNNNLTLLPKLPRNLYYFSCDSNQIDCLPLLPITIVDAKVSGNHFTCIPNLPPSPFFSIDIPVVICATKCSNFDNFITGQVFVDQNSNGQPDATEHRLERHILAANGENTASDRFGNYAFYLDSGSYALSITPLKWHTLGTPATPYTFNFPANDSIVRDVNFGFVPTPNITDVAVQLTAVDRPRPGFSFCYNLSYKNEGTDTASGTVSLNIDPQLNYTGQTVFSFNNLPVWSSWDTTVCLTVPVSLALGTPLASTATITPTLPDADTTNNRATETSVVVGSYDPNDKSCSPESLTPTEVTAGKRLTYTIRFQNTGTAEAYFVFIEDTLDAAHLDVSSLEVIAASHAYEMSLSGPGHVKFMFHNIMLPDSTTDEPNSHGFIKYSIRPKSSLALGDQISNTAHIYFDFNPAIVTNTVLTEVAQPSGLYEAALGTLSLQPNPASTSVVLRADALAGQAVHLTVLDLTGRAVYQASETLFTGQTALNLSDLPAGCYIVQLQAQGGVLSQKLIVVR